MNACEEAKQFVLLRLERDIAAHERGDYGAIGRMMDLVPSLADCDARDDDEADRVSTAINFWDRWIDARNHDWGYYPGVERDDWPIIARQICAGLREGWDTDRMHDNFVFNPPPRPPKVSWLTRLFSK